MNKQEADKLVAKCKMLWGNPFKVTSTTALDWAQHSGDVPYEHMDKALDSFAEEGDKFPPSLAELIHRARSYRDGNRNYVSVDASYELAVCNHCGGPYWSGNQSDGHWKQHYSFCYDEGGPFVLADEPTLPKYSISPNDFVPMPDEVKIKLKALMK